MGGMNLSFAGCGFLGIYHVGVAVCFKKYAPHLLLEKIGGASAGALAACCLLCDLPLGEMTSDFFRVVREARKHSLGPFSPSFSIQQCLLEGLQKHLPPDAHKRVSGRLHVSLTRVYDGKNVIVSEFNSREDVLQALLCACFIPGFSGILPPKFHGVRYMDGGFSDNLPILDENTVTVSPFCGESDICPRDQSSQLFHLNWANTSIEISRQNISRFIRILFPPKPELLSNLCQQGFDDALQFLHRNNLISCRRCVAVQSTFVVSETISSESQDYDPECNECKKHRKDALLANMPETVLAVIQDYIDSANKGLANWLFKHKGIKLLSLPATVPADFLIATISKLLKIAPKLTESIRKLTKLLLSYLREYIKTKLAYKTKILDSNQNDHFGNLENSKRYGSKLSILIDENGAHLKYSDGDTDTFDHILKVTTHHDSIYAYYYTDDDSNKVKVTEIFDMTETENLPPELNNILDNSSINSLQHIENEWNGTESDLLFGLSSNDIHSSTLIEANNNIYTNNSNYIKDFKNYSGIEIEEISSDPEVDNHLQIERLPKSDSENSETEDDSRDRLESIIVKESGGSMVKAEREKNENCVIVVEESENNLIEAERKMSKSIVIEEFES